MKHANENHDAIGILSRGFATAETTMADYIQTATRLSGMARDGIAMEVVTYMREAAAHLNAAAFLIASRIASVPSQTVQTELDAASDMFEELQDLLDGVGPVEVSH
jgi:hypothetical protein